MHGFLIILCLAAFVKGTSKTYFINEHSYGCPNLPIPIRLNNDDEWLIRNEDYLAIKRKKIAVFPTLLRGA